MEERNLFKEARNKVSIVKVITRVLGTPDKVEGSQVIWHSPVKPENHASFSVNEEKQIASDFSQSNFGKGLDVCDVLVQLNNHPDSRKKGFIANRNINNYEALKWLNKEFCLNLNLNSNYDVSNPYVTTDEKSKTIIKLYSLEQTDKIASDEDEIFSMFDTEEFKQKPEGKDVGKIKYRIENKLEAHVYNLNEIKENLVKGRTCIPSAIKSKKQWIDGENYYQIFMVDIDNVLTEGKTRTKLTIKDKKHVTVKEVVEYCKSINLDPTFVYYTFSHTEEQHKFRLVYVLENMVHSKEEIEGVYTWFKTIFQDYHIDNSATDIARIFYGGTSIAYESNKFYKIKTIEEEIEKEENNEIAKNNNIVETTEMKQLADICNNYLYYTKYRVAGGKLWYLQNEKKATPISNFIVFVRNKATYKNGIDETIKYEMECHILDAPSIKLPNINIDVDSYSKMNFIDGSAWDKYAIYSAGKTNQEKQKEVMKIISRKTMQEIVVYSHTGITKIDDKLCYLYHGGNIGEVANISVDLSNDGLQRYCFTDREFDKAQALKRSLSFLDVANYKITIPIIATIYLSPLKSILGKHDILMDYILFIQGRSGTRKSSLAAVALSHFGNFNRDTFPTTFRDTLNSIEKTAYTLKDTVTVIDDYNPENIGNSKLSVMEKIFAMYGDRVGRKRMTRDAEIKVPYVARGLCIVTGEMIPEVAQSRIARSIITTIKQDSIDLKKLAELQKNKEELAYCMMNYIRWIIDNEDKIIKYAKTTLEKINSNTSLKAHGRTIETSNILWIGFTIFTQFLMEFKVLDVTEKNKLDDIADKVLNELAEGQTQYVEELKPTDMFYDAVEELINSAKIRILDINEYPRVLR